MAKREAKKVQVNPYEELAGMVGELGIQQFRVQLTRKDPVKKTWRTVTHFNGIPAEDVGRLEEIVQAQYGGGEYCAHIMHPGDVKERYFVYSFELDGPPVQGGGQDMATVWDPVRQAFVPVGQQTVYGGQVQVHPLTGQPIPPTSPMMQPYFPQPYYPPPPPWGYGGYPYPPPQQHHQEKSGPSPEEVALREQLKAMEKQHEDLMRKWEEEKHQRELDRRETETNRKLDALQSAHKEEMIALKAAIEKTGDKDTNAMLTTMLELNKGTQEAIIAMKKGEVDSAKANIEYMQKQMEKDFEYRKDMFGMIQAAQDPSKNAELMNRFGEFAASNLNMIMQLAQSGILGGDNQPPWLEPVKEAIGAVQEFGKEFLENQRQQDGWRRATSTHPNQRPPQPPRGLPGGQQQGQKQQQRPPAQQQGQGPTAPSGDVPDTMKAPLQAIGRAIYAKEPPEMVGEMIYNVADYHRYWRMLPTDWTGIFTEPKPIILAVLKKHAPMVKPADDYMDAICAVLLQIESDFQREQTAARQAAEQARGVQQQQPPEEEEEQKVIEGEAKPVEGVSQQQATE